MDSQPSAHYLHQERKEYNAQSRVRMPAGVVMLVMVVTGWCLAYYLSSILQGGWPVF
jgi:hypothetical protein